MSTIVTRYGKGSPLTWLEVDNNFTNLNTDKIQSGDTVSALTITTATINGGTITGITDLAVADGGTGLSSLTAGYIPYGAGTSAFGSSANLFWDSANSRLGIGTSSPSTKLTISANTALPSAGSPNTTSSIWTVGADSTATGISMDSFGTQSHLILRRANGTSASPSALLSGNIIFQFSARGYGTTGYASGGRAQFTFNAAENWTDTAQGTYIAFNTTANTTTTLSERMRIDDAGNVGIGTSSPAANTRLTLSDTQTVKLKLTGGSAQNGYILDSVSASNQYYVGAGNNLLNAGDKGFVIYDVTNSVSKLLFLDNVGETRLSGTTYSTFYTNSSERMRIDSAGLIGIGTASPSALLTLAAGTATANTSPLKFTSGTNLTTPEAGSVEYDGTIITATTNTSFKRGTIPITNYTSGAGTNLTGNSETTLQNLLPSANDTITLPIGTYFLDVAFNVTRTGTSTTSATARLNILGGGATTVGSFSGMSLSAPTAGGATANFSFSAVNINVSNVLTTASTTAGGVYTMTLRGLLKITTAGTIIPQYNLSATLGAGGAGGASVNVLYFRLQQVDTQSASAFGPAGTGWA